MTNILYSDTFKTADSISNIMKSATINPSLLTTSSLSEHFKNMDKPATLTGKIVDLGNDSDKGESSEEDESQEIDNT
jgi:hypothetical protein